MEPKDLNEKQIEILKKFRNSVSDILTKQHDDIYLIRFLKARDFNADKAEKMLRASLQWRKDWGVDTIMTDWSGSDVLKKYMSMGCPGRDKYGAPVWLVRAGDADLRGILHCVRRTDFIKYSVQYIEKSLQLMRDESKKQNRNITQFIVIFDMKDFELRQMMWKGALDALGYTAQMYEANYPETLRSVYVLNAPWCFNVVMTMVKPLVREQTLKKFRIFNSDEAKWKAALLEEIPADQLPKHWGGTKVDPKTKDPKCPSLVNPGGTVPKNLYFKKDKISGKDIGEFKTVTVSQGSSFKIDLNIKKPGSQIKWEFRTEGHDIGFAIYRKDRRGNETPLVPMSRVNSHQAPEEGLLPVDRRSVYVLAFDNTYSALRSKQLTYSVCILSPENISKGRA